jgi:hypothetical protein
MITHSRASDQISKQRNSLEWLETLLGVHLTLDTEWVNRSFRLPDLIGGF